MGRGRDGNRRQRPSALRGPILHPCLQKFEKCTRVLPLRFIFKCRIVFGGSGRVAVAEPQFSLLHVTFFIDLYFLELRAAVFLIL